MIDHSASLENRKAEVTGRLKSHKNFKMMWFLRKLYYNHEILHEETAVQDLFRSFFRNQFNLLDGC